MKFAICNEIFTGWPLERVFAYAAKLGYSAIELAPFTLAASVSDVSSGTRSGIRSMAARSSLAIAGIHWVLARTENLHLSHPDAGLRCKTAAYMAQLVDFCADIGGEVVVVGSPKQRSVLPGVCADQATTWALESFRPAVECAEKRGVTICLEPLGPAETNFINTAGEAVQFMDRVASPNFKIILDVKAMCSEKKPIPQIIRESWPHFAHFHANDPNLKGPGFGKVDFQPIAQALTAVGYNGFVSVEVFDFSDGPETIATKSLACLRKAFSISS
jgi:sugar phosphate isomerase/epimerase